MASKMERKPFEVLSSMAEEQNLELDSPEFSTFLDDIDELKDTRQEFVIPKIKTLPCEIMGDPEEDCIYMLGNSLGLKPKLADKYLSEQLECWGARAAYVHTSGRVPAAYADQPVKAFLQKIVGAKLPSEVTIMNSLTVNLHLLMLAFYRPKGTKNKIMIEDHAFPSDRYAARSMLKFHGIDEDRLLVLKPRDGATSDLLRTEDILETIRAEAENLALIILPGVQYYTGQKFDMESISRLANQLKIPIGWDLAHAVGNVELKLHEWQADFAVWCSYKYLNSGAGGVGGVFFHKRHHETPPVHLQGWWGNKQETRFEMRDYIDPSIGAETFRLSNPPPWLASLHLASLTIFERVGMQKILRKQFLLTGYLEALLNMKLPESVRIITPEDPEHRGCQISFVVSKSDSTYQFLQSRGVICDQRDNVIRVAPVPLYNTYKDVWKFVHYLEQATE